MVNGKMDSINKIHALENNGNFPGSFYHSIKLYMCMFC